MMNWTKIKQSSSMLMIVIIISKVIGMLRDIVLAKYFGTSNISDAYLIASSVPVLLFYFIGHSLSTAYIPMYNKVKYQKNESKALEFSNNMLNISLIISTVITIILFICPEIVVKIFATGFDHSTSMIASRLIRISAASIYLMSIVHICGGYLQANKSFLAPAAISVPRNLGIVISVILASMFGIDILGWGLLFAYFLEFIFLLPFVARKGYKYSFKLNIKDDNIKETLYVVMPILLGMCVSQINKIIDKSIASTVSVGAISALSYASIINSAVQEILVTGIITILFSKCAQLVAEGKDKLVLQKLSSTIKTMLYLLIPASVGVIVLAEPIVKTVLCRGNFDENSIFMTTGALRCYTVGLVFLAIRDTLVKVFYAYKDTKKTTITSIVAISINIILNLMFARRLGIKGLALATSVSAIVHCCILYYLLHKKIGDFGIVENIRLLIKCVFAALIMGVVINQCYSHIIIYLNGIMSLFFTVVLGAVCYLVITFVIRCEPIKMFLKKYEKR